MNTIARRIKSVGLLSAFLMAALISVQIKADTYPSKPVRIVVPGTSGTTADITARRVAQGMSSLLKQAFVVEDRAGAGGIIASEYVAKAPPDGYTLLAGTLNTHGMNPWLYKNLPYDPIRDFAPITRIFGFPNVLAVTSSLNVNTLAELVALAKQRQGKPLSYASGGVGTTPHLSAELLKQAVGIELLHVPYQGSSVAMTDVLSGRVDMLFSNAPVLLPHVKSGALKALTVTSATRSPLMPSVPTAEEVGLKELTFDVWIALFAPKGTPPDIVNTLSKAALKTLQLPEILQSYAKDGGKVVKDDTPEDFARALKSDIDRWGRVVKAAGITAN